tara:strand:+ start:295 stop:642 length:348 start_codon:yes stop_codon:yes gene_type:complete
MNATENRGGEAHINNDNTNNAGGNFQRAIVPIQDVSEILSKYDFKEKIGTGGKTTIYDYPAVPSRLLILVSVVDFFLKLNFPLLLSPKLFKHRFRNRHASDRERYGCRSRNQGKK